MIHAYDKVFLTDAQTVMGYLFDHAVCYMGFELSAFFDLFLATDISKRIEKGDPFIVCGKSGTELCYEVLEVFNMDYSRKEREISLEKSPQFWTGWALAYYQWYSGKDFSTINKEVPIDKVFDMYVPYHEMDILQFVDNMDDVRRKLRLMTYLKLYRKKLGYSQNEVAIASGVPLRTLQQYEQGQKNINNAKVEYVVSLARVLGCRVEDLLES